MKVDEVEAVRRTLVAPSPDPEARARARARLRAAMAQTAPVTGTLPRHRRRRLGIAVAAAALVAALMVGQSILRSPVSAASELRRLATLAGSEPANSIPEGSSFYTERTETDFNTFTLPSGAAVQFSVDRTIQTWTGPDGAFARKTVSEEPTFPTQADQQAYDALDPLDPAGTTSEYFARGPLTGLSLADLPTDANTLESMLRSGQVVLRGSDDSDVFSLIGELLTATPASPSLRSALFEVAARLPSVESAGMVTDPIGRQGVGFRLPAGHLVQELIFDPATSALVANLTFDALSGATVASEVYTNQGIVSTPPPVPDGLSRRDPAPTGSS
jgi:hypothetical protein